MKSVEELEKVANAGDSTAQYELGVKYKEGDGVPVDKETAFKWILLVLRKMSPHKPCYFCLKFMVEGRG